MQVQKVFAGILVRDLASASEWYARVFGRSFDTAPMAELVEWHLLDRGWVQVVHDEERAGNSSVAIVVDSVDDQLAALAAEGIQAGSVQTSPGFVKTGPVTDPDGNWVTFVEELSGTT